MGVAEGLKKLFFQKWRVYPTQDFPIILKSSKKHCRHIIISIITIDNFIAMEAKTISIGVVRESIPYSHIILHRTSKLQYYAGANVGLFQKCISFDQS
ncbi:hypothetical protein V1478_002776 [Vespula squamosa]|uniref:Uncharacterized protein n=1 Tax=Vespula squamosa TaxID=30214 RepID=A0ABD2BSY3_VESSQ